MSRCTHKELRPSQMKTSESNTKKVVGAICGFTNPFEVENRDELYCLSSGIPANSTVSDNLPQATDLGKKAMEQFIKERLVDRTKKFHDPVTRIKLQTFASTEKRQQVRTSQNKIIEVRAERDIFAQLVLLLLQHDIDLELTMSYQLGLVPWALGTADGSPWKSEKSKLLHNLEGNVVPQK